MHVVQQGRKKSSAERKKKVGNARVVVKDSETTVLRSIHGEKIQTNAGAFQKLHNEGYHCTVQDPLARGSQTPIIQAKITTPRININIPSSPALPLFKQMTGVVGSGGDVGGRYLLVHLRRLLLFERHLLIDLRLRIGLHLSRLDIAGVGSGGATKASAAVGNAVSVQVVSCATKVSRRALYLLLCHNSPRVKRHLF
jgi:hypothetical protein